MFPARRDACKTDILNRKLWADHFDSQNVKYAFFSAANATALQEARREAAEAEARIREQQEEEDQVQTSRSPKRASFEATTSRVSTVPGSSEEAESGGDESASDEGQPTDSPDEEYSDDDDDDDERGAFLPIDEESEAQDARTRVLSVLELEDLFVKSAPDLSSEYPLFGYHSLPNDGP